MSAWSHLPNAVHIDRVLASVNSHPEVWDQSMDQVSVQARDQAWHQAWHQAWVQAWDQGRKQARDQVWHPARCSLLALITYDDSAKYLKLSIDQLQMLYHLTEHPACLLLQPAAMVFAMERELA
jgi:hypothetical protein